MDLEELLKIVEKSLPDEEMIGEVMREIIKDEVKEYLKEKLRKNPEIEKELKEGIVEYIEAKFKEIASSTKISKSMAKLGIVSLPDNVRNEMIKTLLSVFQKEIDKAIEKTL